MATVTATFVKLTDDEKKQDSDFYLPGANYSATFQAVRSTNFKLQRILAACNGVTLGILTVTWKPSSGRIEPMGDFSGDGVAYCLEGATFDQAIEALEAVGFKQLHFLKDLRDEQEAGESSS